MCTSTIRVLFVHAPFMPYCMCHSLCIQVKETALHLAARGGHLDMVKFLVPQFGVRVYEKNFFRQTCRDIAEQKGHQHVVEYLDSDFPTLKAKVSTTFQCILLSELTEYVYHNSLIIIIIIPQWMFLQYWRSSLSTVCNKRQKQLYSDK